METGLNENDRKKVSEGLKNVLADTYFLYLKTHNFHWNVTGPMFGTLHALFETQYTDMWTAADIIAERIRTLGFPAPGTYKEFSRLTTINEDDGVPSAHDMISSLVKGNEAIIRTIRPVLHLAAEVNDDATADLLTQRLDVHEKAAWMLRSHQG